MTDNSDDVCGYEGTHNSEPCQNVVTGENGRCHLDPHQPDAEGDEDCPQGPPSKLPEKRPEVLKAARMGASKQGCARAAGIHKQTLYNWIQPESDQYDEAFHREFLQARWQGERKYINNPDDIDTRHAQFMLDRSYGYSKTEKREVDASHEHTGEGGGPIEVTVKRERYDPDE